MTDSKQLTHDEIEDLLVARATEGLGESEQKTYDKLVEANPEVEAQAEQYELAAAELDSSYVGDPGDVIPDEVKQKMISIGQHYVVQAQSGPSVVRGTGEPPVLVSFQMVGWYVAMAACIALMFVISRPDPSEPPVNLSTAYSQLVNEPGSVTADWTFNSEAGDEKFKDVDGQVVFNTRTQKGYMKFSGLPKNNPTERQYQLWIVDPSRAAQPVDGGVFDVDTEGEVIVPIDSKLQVDKPTVFAITVEKPGGVVVSEGPLHIVAPVKDGSS